MGKFPIEVTTKENRQPISAALKSGELAAEDLAAEVRLTKFASLPAVEGRANEHVISISEGISQAQQNYCGGSPKNLVFCPFSAPSKCHQASINVGPDQVANNEQVTNVSFEQQQQHNDQARARHFQVVWRSLKFEVGTSTYDRLMNVAFDGMNSVLKLACSSSAKENNLSSTCELAQNQQSQSQESLPKRNRASAEVRSVFKNLNGYVRSGEISAILGPSGAGKTSLLNALCGGKMDNYRGSIQVLGGDNQKSRMQLSIIPQKDYLIENLTVRENLIYSSQLLNPGKDVNHEAKIMRVVKMLNLGHCFDSSAANISGGEYKRVSIAQELLRQPDILILDEPTSGLDSLNCKKLIGTLKQLIEASKVGTMKPIAVVMTIHQPDIDIFHMFDHVYCMARAGRVIFDGRPGDAMATLKSFAGFRAGDPDCPAEISEDRMVNPANLLIEIASEELYGSAPVERLARLQRKQFEQMFGSLDERNHSQDQQRLASSLHSSPSSSSLSDSDGDAEIDADADMPPTKCLKRDKRLQAKHDHRGRFWYHTRLLTRRAFVSTLRDPLMTMISLAFHLFLPFVMWSVYPRRVGRINACPVIQRDLDIISMASNQTLQRMGDMQSDTMATVDCSTMLFITTYALSMCSLSVAALAFPLNMHILLKEVRNGWYDMKTFVLAKQLASFPFEVLFPSITMIMIYLMLDMPPSSYEWRLWSIALVMATIAMISNTHGLIIGTLCMDSVQTAVFLSIASTLPQVLLSGFTARLKWMPLLFQHLSWTSQYRYAQELINTIRFGFGICPCDETTDEYLRSKKAQFTDIPENVKTMFLYYLSVGNETPETTTTTLGLPTNGTVLETNSTLSPMDATMSNTDIPGISKDLLLGQSEKTALIARMEANEVDVFGQMAEMMSRSLTFGREITSCKSVKSQLLEFTDTNTEDRLLIVVASMIALLLFCKISLFFVVKYKVGSRT